MFPPGRCLLLVWLMLGSAISIFSGVAADQCFHYPFDSCPRPGDLSTDTACCINKQRYSCCNKYLVQGWAVVLLVGGCVLIVGALVTLICCCCGCCPRKNRREYTVIRDSVAPQSQLQPGVVVVTPPPPPPSQYGYRTMGYPSPLQPSYVVQPPYTAQNNTEQTKTDPGTEGGEAVTQL